jgi:uncharacterized protein
LVVGVISDTHGLLRIEAVNALRGAELIIHAGDVGSADILESLREIAPVLAVRGNIDRGRWATLLPTSARTEFEGHALYVIHDRSQLDLDPARAGISAVISGHSHKPMAEHHEGVLFLNPGSAGPRRFRLPITIAHLNVVEGRLIADIVDLAGAAGGAGPRVP